MGWGGVGWGGVGWGGVGWEVAPLSTWLFQGSHKDQHFGANTVVFGFVWGFPAKSTRAPRVFPIATGGLRLLPCAFCFNWVG